VSVVVSPDPSPPTDSERLPITYQRVLAWLEAGCSEEELARRLQVEPQAVPAVVSLAQAKLARLRAGSPKHSSPPAKNEVPPC
jgi:hypothetical protein